MLFRIDFLRTAPLFNVVCAVTLLLATGCGGGSSEAPSTDKGSSSSTSSTEKSSSKSAGSTSSGSTLSTGKESTTREIDGIPLDVFYDRPLEVAADSRTGGTAPGLTTAQTTATAETPASEPTADSAPKAVDVSWSELIPAEQLNDEVRFLRNEMQSRLTNMGGYKKSTLELPVFGSAIAFFAEVATRHDGDISWKENAKYIRVLGTRIAEVTSSAQAQTRNSYDEVNDAFLTISEILNNNTPAELPEVEEEAPDFADFADMTYLMKRLERGQEWLQTNTGSESGFTDKRATALRETAVMAALTQSFYSENYGYADDEEFTGYLDLLREAGTGMHKAVEEKDFAKYDELRSQAGQQCTQCHSVFKNG